MELLKCFMSSVTNQTGSASFYPTIIPIIGAIAINLFLPKLEKAKFVLPLAILIFFIGT